MEELAGGRAGRGRAGGALVWRLLVRPLLERVWRPDSASGRRPPDSVMPSSASGMESRRARRAEVPAGDGDEPRLLRPVGCAAVLARRGLAAGGGPQAVGDVRPPDARDRVGADVPGAGDGGVRPGGAGLALGGLQQDAGGRQGAGRGGPSVTRPERRARLRAQPRNSRLLETLERLERAGVGFVSISEQMDFTTPIGKVILATLAAFAQYYSRQPVRRDQEGQGRAQGPGALQRPAALRRSRRTATALPVPDPETYPRSAARLPPGRRGQERPRRRRRAQRGRLPHHRQPGPQPVHQGHRPPSCSRTASTSASCRTARAAGCPAAHEPVLDADLFDAGAAARARANRTGAGQGPARATARHSLSGLGVCGHCGGRLHVQTDRARQGALYCYRGAARRDGCGQRSAFLDVIEDADRAPTCDASGCPTRRRRDRGRLYERRSDRARTTPSAGGARSTARLERIKELYSWGDLTEAEYRAERDRLEARAGGAARRPTDRAAVLAAGGGLPARPAGRLGGGDAGAAQRAGAAGLRVGGDQGRPGVAVVPQPDFAPFFVRAGHGRKTTTAGPPGSRQAESERAEATGFEPAISALTGLHVRPLHHASVFRSVLYDIREGASTGREWSKSPAWTPRLALDAGQGDAADEGALAEEEDDDHRQHADDRGRHQQWIGVGSVPGRRTAAAPTATTILLWVLR